MKSFLLCGAAALAFTSLSAAPVLAQDGEDERSAVRGDTIIVTGRKKEETLLEAPIAITAFTDRDIQESGITDIRDVGDFTPGLQYDGDFGRSAERPVIRGLANLRPETPQPVSVFIDGVYIRSGIISTILDNVDRVEVLKGPQAALYGRSTYGGVINYITKAPGDEFGGRLTASGATQDEYSVSGYIDGPISDSLSATLGAYFRTYGGDWENTSPFAGGRDVGSEETVAVYTKLRFEPSDNFVANLSLNYSRDRDGQFAGSLTLSDGNNSVPAGGTACPEVTRSAFCGVIEPVETVNIATNIPDGTTVLVPFAPGAPGGTPVTTVGDFVAGLDRNIFRAGLTMSVDIEGGYTLESLTGYSNEELNVNTDQSYGGFIATNPFFSGPAVWVTLDQNDRHDFYQELRLSSPTGGFVEWLIGGIYYENTDENVGRDIDEPNLTFTPEDFESEVAAFGRLAFNLSDSFTLGFEGRYYYEEVKQLGAFIGGMDRQASYSGFSPRVTADFQITDSTLLYALAARGNKRGGFNDVRALPPLDTFQEEEVWAYEAGIKTRTFDDVLTLTLAGYFNDISNQQLSQSVAFPNPDGMGPDIQVTVVSNIGKTEVYGLELDATLTPTDQFLLRGTYALSDSEITEGTDPVQGGFFASDSIVGFTTPRVPKHSATITGSYTQPTSFGEVYLRADGIYTSSKFAAVQNIIETGDAFVVNARIGVRLNDNVDISIFGDNIFDEDTIVNAFRYVDPSSFRFFRRGGNVGFQRRGAQFGGRITLDF